MANHTNILQLSNLDQIQSRSYMRVLLCIRFPTEEAHLMLQATSRLKHSIALLLSQHPYLAGRVRFISDDQRFSIFWTSSNQTQEIDDIFQVSYPKNSISAKVHGGSAISYSYAHLRDVGFPLSKLKCKALQPCPESPDLIHEGGRPIAIKATFIDGGLLLAVYVLSLVMDGQAVCSLLNSLAMLNCDPSPNDIGTNYEPSEGSPQVRAIFSDAFGSLDSDGPKCTELRIMSATELKILETRLNLKVFKKRFEKSENALSKTDQKIRKHLVLPSDENKTDIFKNFITGSKNGERKDLFKAQIGEEHIKAVVFPLAMSNVYIATERVIETIASGAVMPSVHDVLLAILWINITRARHHMRKWVNMPLTSKLVFPYNTRPFVLKSYSETPYLGNASVYVVAELPVAWLADPLTTGAQGPPAESVSWWRRLAHVSQTIRLAILAVNPQYVRDRINVVNQATLLSSILPTLKLHDGLDFLISSWASAVLHEKVPSQFNLHNHGLSSYLQRNSIAGGLPIEAIRRIGDEPEDGMCFIMPPRKLNRNVRAKDGTVIKTDFQKRTREEVFHPVDTRARNPDKMEVSSKQPTPALQADYWKSESLGKRQSKLRNVNWVLDVQVQLDDFSMSRLCNYQAFTNCVEKIIE